MAGRIPQHRAVALILAAGAGERLGGSGPKAFEPLGDRPMVSFSLEAAASSALVGSIVVVTPAGHGSDPEWRSLVIRGSTARDVPVGFTVGGATRQESVRLGLAALPPEPDVVVVHDAARPFAPPALFDRTIEALVAPGGVGSVAGAIPVVPCPDTVKRVRDGVVVQTVPRGDLVLVQTPQAFLAAALRDAHAQAARSGLAATDDAMVLEAAGYRVATVPGEPSNFKITTPEDLARAERDLAIRAVPGPLP
jgi:2-C-methyl-D-erythritol 4-phosphate cytidylyltransferase